MREIKFDFIYKGDTQYHHKVYSLDQLITTPLYRLSDVHGSMKLIAKRQYTGIKDKSGKEIYEGDKLRQWDHDYSNCLGVGVVTYIDHAFWCVDRHDSHSWPHYCEIIGNIHESQELLDE